jgi:heat-inducible transcriptional repressor
MALRDRQIEILEAVIDEYINTAMPVSSATVFDMCDLDVSCPTIRNEMAELTDMGLLAQPHTSAGRVPTEQGYRFFVDNLISNSARKIRKQKEKQPTRPQNVNTKVKEVSAKATNTAVLFIDENGEMRYVGLKKVFSNPEFSNRNAILSLIEELERFESSIDEVLERLDKDFEVFIGSENPFFERDDFSMVSSPFGNSFIALVGPTRMNYRRNVSLLEGLLWV